MIVYIGIIQIYGKLRLQFCLNLLSSYGSWIDSWLNMWIFFTFSSISSIKASIFCVAIWLILWQLGLVNLGNDYETVAILLDIKNCHIHLFDPGPYLLRRKDHLRPKHSRVFCLNKIYFSSFKIMKRHVTFLVKDSLTVGHRHHCHCHYDAMFSLHCVLYCVVAQQTLSSFSTRI